MLSQSPCHNKMYMLKFDENEVLSRKYMTYEYFDRDYLNQIDQDHNDLQNTINQITQNKEFAPSMDGKSEFDAPIEL